MAELDKLIQKEKSEFIDPYKSFTQRKYIVTKINGKIVIGFNRQAIDEALK